MERLLLREPVFADEEIIQEYIREMQTNNNELAGGIILEKCQSIRKYILLREEYRKTFPTRKIPYTMYLAIRKADNALVGLIDVRDYINKNTGEKQGERDIGYSVRPTERQKGYGKEMLKLLLDKLKNSDLDKVIARCSKSNIGSRNILIANGGILINTGKPFINKNRVEYDTYVLNIKRILNRDTFNR